MLKLIVVIVALLVLGSQGRKISVHSKGAYVARCFVDVKDHLGTLTLATGSIYAGQTRDVAVPEDITWMKIRCENQRLVGKWGEVFTQESLGARALCYTIAGTTFHPTHSASISC